MFKIFCALIVLSFGISAKANVTKEEVRLKNGDRLTGTVISKDEENVVLETAYAGKITIGLEHIDKIVPPAKAAEDAAVAEAKPADKPEAEEAPKAEEKTVKEAAEKADAKPPAKPTSPIKPVPKLFGEGAFFGIANGWNGDANIGFSYTTGNSRTSTMTTNIRGVKSGHSDKLTVYSRSLWNNNRNTDTPVTTQNAVWGGLRYDRNVNDRMFGFVSYDFERDRPRKLNYRSVLGGGIGHHTIKNDRTELELFAGGGWNRTWMVGPNTDTPEALAGNTFKHKINSKLRLQQSFTIYQNMTDINEFRFIFDTTVSVDITKRIGWHFTIGDRYNNDPAGNARSNDFLFTTGMRWNFGKRK